MSDSKKSLFQNGTVCIILQGRYAGKKGVVVQRQQVDNKHERVVIAGIEKIRKSAFKSGKSPLKTFLKLYNQSHLMPTRHTIKDVARIGYPNAKHTEVSYVRNYVEKKGFKSSTEKAKALEEANKALTKLSQTNREHWLFKKLEF